MNSIFRIYVSNMSIPWLNKKESCKSFKAELAYQFAILNGQVCCDERFQFLTIELRRSCRIESMVKGQTLYQKLVDRRQPASNDLTQRIYATINFLSFLVSYYFIFKKSKKLIEIWNLGMSQQYCYQGRAGILKQSLCGVTYFLQLFRDVANMHE